MQISELTYVADGLMMRSELYIPEGEGQRPGVLVFPEAFGLGEHARSRAKELAELGYIALAGDLYGDSTLYQDAGAVSALLRPLATTPERIRARAQGALDALFNLPKVGPARIAAIGFCFGGSMALELARSGGTAGRDDRISQWPANGSTGRCEEHSRPDPGCDRSG